MCFAGVFPSSCLNRRAKFRVLMAAGALQSQPVQESRLVMQLARTHAPSYQKCIDRPAILSVRPIRVYPRAEMIRSHSVGARRNDVDLVCRSSTEQPIRIAEHLGGPEHIEGPHWRNGDNQDTKR